ncbi:hypothetical protein D3C76_965520 [compost metagenome]
MHHLMLRSHCKYGFLFDRKERITCDQNSILRPEQGDMSGTMSRGMDPFPALRTRDSPVFRQGMNG